MRIDNDPKLDFDDVLIRPKRSEAPSRATIVLQRAYQFLNSGAAWKGIPIVASNMDTVGTMAMAEALGPEMMTCLHKYYPEDRLDRVLRGRSPIGPAPSSRWGSRTTSSTSCGPSRRRRIFASSASMRRTVTPSTSWSGSSGSGRHSRR